MTHPIKKKTDSYKSKLTSQKLGTSDVPISRLSLTIGPDLPLISTLNTPSAPTLLVQINLTWSFR